MPEIIYEVQWVRDDLTYWVTAKCFYDKDTAEAWCKYKQENDYDDRRRWRVVEEEII